MFGVFLIASCFICSSCWGVKKHFRLTVYLSKVLQICEKHKVNQIISLLPSGFCSFKHFPKYFMSFIWFDFKEMEVKKTKKAFFTQKLDFIVSVLETRTETRGRAPQQKANFNELWRFLSMRVWVFPEWLSTFSFQLRTSKFTCWRTESVCPRRRPSRSGSLWILSTTRFWSSQKAHRGK